MKAKTYRNGSDIIFSSLMFSGIGLAIKYEFLVKHKLIILMTKLSVIITRFVILVLLSILALQASGYLNTKQQPIHQTIRVDTNPKM